MLNDITKDGREAANITETGLRQEGGFENTRNAISADLFKRVIREVYGVTDVIIAHHLVYVVEEAHADGFKYQIVEEIPSADTLIFDHGVARKLFGEGWAAALTRLALEPVETRDALYGQLLDERCH